MELFMDYTQYEIELEKIKKVNEEYLKKFTKWLREKKLSDKTIKNHVDNVDLYINDYLNYYEVHEMQHGCGANIDSFLGDWFIRKCLWSTVYSIKTTATSIKKFYQCMSELGFIEKKSYEKLCFIIKDNMEEWIEEVELYNSDEDLDYWDLI